MKEATDRLTPLGVMVLALLREGDMHPYQMIRLLRERHEDRLLTITGGTVYHTVSRLDQLGLLHPSGSDRNGNRPERTTYALTRTGLDAITTWVQQELRRIDHPMEFRVALAESHNIDPNNAADLLSLRRAALAHKHRMHREGLESARRCGVPEQYLLEVERQDVLLRADLDWMDDLIARIERGEFSGEPPDSPTPEDHDNDIAPWKAVRQ